MLNFGGKRRYLKLQNYEEYRQLVRALVAFRNQTISDGIPCNDINAVMQRAIGLKEDNDGTRTLMIKGSMEHSVVYCALRRKMETEKKEGKPAVDSQNLYMKAYRAPTREDQREQRRAEMVR